MNENADIYVPIDFSNASESLPPGEDIIYSTAAIGTAYDLSKTTKFSTHILMTKNGFAFTIPTKKKKDPPISKYIPWEDIQTIGKDRITLGGRSWLKLINIKAYETSQSFKERSKVFPLKVLPFFLEQKKKWIEEQEAQGKKIGLIEKNFYKSTMKFYENLKKKLGIE